MNPIIDQNQRTGAGTIDNPLTNIQVNDLSARGINEGDVVPGKGVLSPLGTFPGTNTASEPTIGETLKSIQDRALQLIQERDKGKSKTGSGITTPTYDEDPSYEDLYPEIDESAVRRNQLKLFQGQIDATNAIYDDMLAEERLAGQGRLGTGRAIAARGGLLGSDFGAAQKDRIVGANTQAERAVQNERNAKIGSIMGTMRQAVADELVQKRQARQQGAENYISYLASSRERKQSNAKLAAQSILNAGIDIADMDEAEIAAIGKEAGLSAQDIIMAYQSVQSSLDEAGLETRKTEAEIKKIEADIAKGKLITIGEGTMLYNTETGETFKNPKTYAPGSGSDSSISLTADDKRTLLGGGWSEGDIATLEAGVRSEGLQSVIAAEKAAGATSAQIKALEKAYGSTSEDTNQFLSKDYFRNLFGEDAIRESAKEAGTVSGGDDYIPFNEKGDVESFLTGLESKVELYRQAGYTDQEILKMMQ